MKTLHVLHDYELALGAPVALADGMVTLRFNAIADNPWDDTVIVVVTAAGNDAVAVRLPRECITILTGYGDVA